MSKNTICISVAAAMLASAPAYAGIKGATTFKGKAPAAKAVDMSSDPKCAAMSKGAKDNSVVVNGDKLANVFVYVKNPPKKKYKPIVKDVVLDQKGCRYHPKVFGVMTKQKFTIVNSDPTLHNVHAFAKRGEFNNAMPRQGQKIKKKFKKEQIMVPIKCDVHSWMASYAGVLSHPFFAVSGDDGSFELPTDGLADGTYEVVAWHEKFGEKKGSVTVSGGAGSVSFSFN